MQQLLKRIKQNDSTAQTRLYKMFASKMLFTGMRYTGNEFDAEEILHNGFCKVFNNLNTFNFINEKLLKAGCAAFAIPVLFKLE